MNSKPQRAQGGLGLLSHTISVQKSQQSIPLILEKRGRKRETGRERQGEGAREEVRAAVVFLLARREREREERGI